MKKIYTLLTRKSLVFCAALCLLSTVSFSQICGTIRENFNNTGGTTADFTGDFSYDAVGQRLIRRNVIATAVYVITTPTYQLPLSESSLGFGFLLDGTERVSRVEVVVVYVSTLTNQLTSIFLTQFVPNYGVGTTANVCQAVGLSSLPGFPAGGKYRFRLEFTTNTGTGIAAQTTTFDDFRTNGALSAALPVTFVGFDARKMSVGAQLTWKVAGEENVNHYEVERSTDGRKFTSIVSIATTKKDTYTFLDANTENSVYYRIKNVDNDGKFKYSSIARISNGKASIVIKAFPQPVLSQLTVQHPVIRGNALLTISTADGRIVNALKPLTGSMQTYADMSLLQKGLYMVRFSDGEGNIETMKVIKQ